ncbi:hypothetical protein [Pontibacter virosus]|uniref:Immunity protein 50 of polymorphic toxin system n=1 Tax=Pontibacter virosus TaxID=1765052 RepID=A0A2U1AZR5_9BACT|nr:hypothetical protein [Pontibacter virosus]PVY41915.1 hypothetical protein C8E01_104287 [Pontibacter virosus]
MKLTNFEIEDTVTLHYTGLYLDLHNDYDFHEFKYSLSSQVFEIQWDKLETEETTSNNIDKFKLRFSAVSFLKIQERDAEVPVSEDKCLDVLGWLPQNMRQVMDSFGLKPDYKNDDMILIFRGGQTIKINAEQVDLIVLEQ